VSRLRSLPTAYWTVGSACSGMSRRIRFQKTAEMSGISLDSTASFSMMEASVSTWCRLMSRPRASASRSGEIFSRIRATMRARISSGVMPLTNW